MARAGLRTAAGVLVATGLFAAADAAVYMQRASVHLAFDPRNPPPDKVVDGFYPPETTPQGTTFAWTNGRGRMLFPDVDRTTDWQARIRLSSWAWPARAALPIVILDVDGRPEPEQNPTADFHDYTVAVPRKPRGRGLSLGLFSSTFVPAEHDPHSLDRRSLGIAVSTLSLVPRGHVYPSTRAILEAVAFGASLAVPGALSGLGFVGLAVLLTLFGLGYGWASRLGPAAYLPDVTGWQVALWIAGMAAVLFAAVRTTGRLNGLHKRWSIWAPALLLVLVAAVDVVCMPAVFWAGDPAAWREETKALLHGELAVDAKLAEGFGEPGQYFVLNTSRPVARWYSKFGITNSLMSLPPMLVDRWRSGTTRAPGERPDLLIFNLYQIVLSLLVCATLYRLSGWYTSRIVTRVIYVLAVFYATYFWYYQRAQSSELYQVLFYSAFFYFFVGYLRALERTNGRPGWRSRAGLLAAWVFAGLLVLSRVLFGLLIPAMFLSSAVAIGRLPRPLRWRATLHMAGLLIVPACVVLGALGLVNWVKFGSPLLTGYHVWHPELIVPRWSYWDGLYGHLFDMPAGALCYFPVLLFALAALRRFYGRYPVDTVTMYLVSGLFFMVLAKTPNIGGWTYGPRYLLFGLPVLALPFLAWVDGLLDQPRRRTSWVAGAVTLAALLYSGYLTERQNRLDFFVYYRVAEALEPYRDRETAQYFSAHHLGWISGDLLAHRGRLDELTFMKGLAKQERPPGFLDDFRHRLENLVSTENYYWKRRVKPPSATARSR